MKISSRLLHHRFMLSCYTRLTTTRGCGERDLNLAQLNATIPLVQAATGYSRKEERHVEGFEKMIPQRA